MHHIARLLLFLFLPLWGLAADPPSAPARKPAKTKNVGALEPEAAPVVAGKRVALILANSNYQSLTRLDNPKRDAALIEKTLKSIGFTVIGGSRNGMELTAGDMQERLGEFARESTNAEVALVYFAGHGVVDHSGEQYLVGVEHRGTSSERLKSEAVALGQIMQTLTDSQAANNLVFLDACREKLRGTDTRAIKPAVDAIYRSHAPAWERSLGRSSVPT